MLMSTGLLKGIQATSGSICPRCLATLSSLNGIGRRNISSSPSSLTSSHPTQRISRRPYFSANGVLDRSGFNVYGPLWSSFFTSRSSRASPPSKQAIHQASVISTFDGQWSQSKIEPLDRRKRRRRRDSRRYTSNDRALPPDASSRLSTLSTSLPPSSLRRLASIYLSLSKPRLSFLMVLTTAASYSLYPTPSLLLSSATDSPSLSALTLVFLTSGTALCAASANTLNMVLEPEHDAKMSRTRNRPLVRGLISKRNAVFFAAATAVLGVAGLNFGVNPTVAFLGGLNIFLYAGIYTPLKRISVLNTWVGAIVGGIPPLMGWAAAAGQSATGNGGWQELLLGEQNVGGWLLAALLFAWQFPHFNALSWTIREEYKNAGYRMLCWTNSRMNGRVALRYALLFFPICAGLTYVGVTDRGFVITSSVVNVWIAREAYRFWKLEGQKGSARGLFCAGGCQLPVLMVMAMVHKNGLWEGVWQSLVGEEELDDEDEMWVMDEEQEKVVAAGQGHKPGLLATSTQ